MYTSCDGLVVEQRYNLFLRVLGEAMDSDWLNEHSY